MAIRKLMEGGRTGELIFLGCCWSAWMTVKNANHFIGQKGRRSIRGIATESRDPALPALSDTYSEQKIVLLTLHFVLVPMIDFTPPLCIAWGYLSPCICIVQPFYLLSVQPCIYNKPFTLLKSPKTFSKAKTSWTMPALTNPIQYPWNSSNNWSIVRRICRDKPYISWHIRATDSVILPCTFIIISFCRSPVDIVCRTVRVIWIPTNAKGYHGSEIWRDWLEPDSSTNLRARTGYVVQNEWSCFSPRRPSC